MYVWQLWSELTAEQNREFSPSIKNWAVASKSFLEFIDWSVVCHVILDVKCCVCESLAQCKIKFLRTMSERYIYWISTKTPMD